MRILEQLKRAWAISKKDLSIYFLKGPTLIFGLLLPGFMFLSFIIGKNQSLALLLPGLIGMTLFFATSAIGPTIVPTESRTGTFERLISAPITLWAILLGDIIASFLFGLFITSFIFLIGIIFLGIEIITLNLIIGTIIAAFCFSSLGVLFSALPTDRTSDVMMLTTLIKFPLIFISGVFIPISEMGGLKLVSYISPLTYYVDLVRLSTQGTSYFGWGINLLILLGFSILIFFISIKIHNKTVTKRF